MSSINSSRARAHVATAAALSALFLLATSCASPSSAASVTVSPRGASANQVLPVEGHVVQVGQRRIAYLEAFPSPSVPVLGAAVQLHVTNAARQQFSAVVTHVEPRTDGWLEVEADVVERDEPLATATPFTGELMLRISEVSR